MVSRIWGKGKSWGRQKPGVGGGQSRWDSGQEGSPVGDKNAEPLVGWLLAAGQDLRLALGDTSSQGQQTESPHLTLFGICHLIFGTSLCNTWEGRCLIPLSQ